MSRKTRRIPVNMLMAVLSLLLTCGICLADSPDYVVPAGIPVIDGIVSDGEWLDDGRHDLHRMHSTDSRIRTYMMWDYSNLYLAAVVSDEHLWDEANAYAWLVYNDDSIEWYIDVNNDKATYMMTDDFLLQVEPGGNVLLNRGDGAGNTVEVTGASYSVKVTYTGTLNDNSDTDTGFTMEAAIPWSTLGASGTDGKALGNSIWRYSDDDGGDWVVDTTAVTTFYSPNEWLTSRGGESGSNRAPDTWGTVVLSDPADATAPSAINDLTVTADRPRSALLAFTAPGDNGASGWAYRYRIYYSADAQATVDQYIEYPNIFKPKQAYETESLRIAGLMPSTTYKLYLIAQDDNRLAGSMSNVTTFTTPDAPVSFNDRGAALPSPNGRYIIAGDGSPILPMGHGLPLGLLHSVFTNPALTLDDFMDDLVDHGVSVIRIFAEDYHAGYPLETSAGVFNQTVLNDLTTVMQAAAEHGLYVVVSPWDTFYFESANGGAGPYSGIISSVRTQWYGTDALKPYQKSRLAKLVDTIGGYDNLLMWELVNEYDNSHWNQEDEATRQAWFAEMAPYLRGIDPNHMIAPSFNSPNPHGYEGRGEFLYVDPIFDISSFHLYYPGIPDPTTYYDLSDRNPYEYASGEDKGFIPAQRTSQALKFAYGQIVHPRPIFNTETGPVESQTGLSAYAAAYTQADDERMFNAINWAHLCGGGDGTGLRYTALTDTSLLTDNMYDFYGLYQAFAAEGIDWAAFNPRNITEDITVTGPDSRYLVKSAVSDGEVALLYLAMDLGAYPEAQTGTTISVPELTPWTWYYVEYWNTEDPTARSAYQTTWQPTDGSGLLTLSAPSWTGGLAAKVYVPEDADIDITGLYIDLTTTPLAVGKPVKIKANAVSNKRLYYRFDLVPGYETSAYNPGNYTIAQDFSYSDTLTQTFSQAGEYILIAYASDTGALKTGAAPIIGGSVMVGEKEPVVMTKFAMNIARPVNKGETVTFYADAFHTSGQTIYYKFIIIPDYGTSGYDTKNAETFQDWSTSKTATYTFEESGGYVAVAYASDTTAWPSWGTPVMGGSLVVQ